VRPLDRFGSIKTKLGLVIVGAVLVTIGANELGYKLGFPLWFRGGIAMLLSLAMVQFLARGMTSPLREMASAARAMAEGDYDKRVIATSRDEVGELARAFNRMADDLAQVDQNRRELIANVSHELRTPIGALQAVLENLIDEVVKPDRESLESMHRQLERLSKLVEQLLDLSRLESGASPLQLRKFSAGDVLRQATEDVRTHAEHQEAKDVAFAIDVPSDLSVVADPERVHQITYNLVANAVRHSPAGGIVRIAALRDDGRVRIEVADQGPGIPADQVERVFDRFYRLDPERPNRDGGTGLGLAIARWIVELHGGDIRVESESPSGCRMVVELPQPVT
jgi:signal transduction histidine kinase